MILRALLVTAYLLATALGGDVLGNIAANNETTPTTQWGNITVHYVTVGKANNNFQPNSINAQPGDIVTFQFFPTNHSVIKAAYGYPCVPYEDLGLSGHGFYSGPMPVTEITNDPPIWNLTINDTQPLFYYCGAPGSCIDWGMVGVINANASTPLSTQIGLARQADFQLLPGEPFPNEAQQASMASLAATATTATLTVTATAAHESGEYSSYPTGGHESDEYGQSSGLSTGAIAGIAVGAAVAGIAAAVLVFLLMRNRSLQKKVKQQEIQQQQPPQGPMIQSPYIDSRHTSTLPPYHAAYTQVGQESKPPGFDREGSPFQNQGQFVPYGAEHPRWTSYTSTSELGSNHPPTELAAPYNPEMAQRDLR